MDDLKALPAVTTKCMDPTCSCTQYLSPLDKPKVPAPPPAPAAASVPAPIQRTPSFVGDPNDDDRPTGNPLLDQLRARKKALEKKASESGAVNSALIAASAPPPPPPPPAQPTPAAVPAPAPAPESEVVLTLDSFKCTACGHGKHFHFNHFAFVPVVDKPAPSSTAADATLAERRESLGNRRHSVSVGFIGSHVA